MKLDLLFQSLYDDSDAEKNLSHIMNLKSPAGCKLKQKELNEVRKYLDSFKYDDKFLKIFRTNIDKLRNFTRMNFI